MPKIQQKFERKKEKKKPCLSIDHVWLCLPGRVCVSLTHCPGLGSGTLDDKTGSQVELEEACSLNRPKKAV